MDEVTADREMITYRGRLATFVTWPFTDGCECTPEKMADAGFYLIANEKEPDLVRCYFCRKELDGWEPEDIPWDEHKRRGCPYIEMNKRSKDLTVEEVFELEKERILIMIRKMADQHQTKFRDRAAEMKERIKQMGFDKQTQAKRKKK